MTFLDEVQTDALKELINIGVGNGAEVLNQMFDSHIELNVPDIHILKPSEVSSYLIKEEIEDLSVINMMFHGDFSGSSKLIFPKASAVKLVNFYTGDLQDSDLNFDAIRVSTLTELGNIVLNAVMGAISNTLQVNFDYIVPNFSEGTLRSIFMQELKKTQIIIIAETTFLIKDMDIKGNIILFLELNTLTSLLSHIENIYQ